MVGIIHFPILGFLRIIQSGFARLWARGAPLASCALSFGPPAVLGQEGFLHEEVLPLLQKGDIEEVDPRMPGNYAELFAGL